MTQPSPDKPSFWRTLLAGQGWAILIIAAATVLIEGGVFAAVLIGREHLPTATQVTLAVMLVWIVIATAPAAAGAKRTYPALLRGAAVIDASALVLLGMWIVGMALDRPKDGSLDFASIAKVYVILATVGLAAMAAVCLPRSTTGRAIAALIGPTVLAGALASPLWIGHWMGQADHAADQAAANLAVLVNPFYAVNHAIVDNLRYVWHAWGWMYEWSKLGDYVNPGQVAWYASAALYALLALLLAALAVLWRRIGKHT